jgi:hypothetical protein
MPKRKPSADEAKKNQASEEVAGLVDAFCREHLNEEYADLCRELTEKLARKRPSPLVGGRSTVERTGYGNEKQNLFVTMPDTVSPCFTTDFCIRENES